MSLYDDLKKHALDEHIAAGIKDLKNDPQNKNIFYALYVLVGYTKRLLPETSKELAILVRYFEQQKHKKNIEEIENGKYGMEQDAKSNNT